MKTYTLDQNDAIAQSIRVKIHALCLTGDRSSYEMVQDRAFKLSMADEYELADHLGLISPEDKAILERLVGMPLELATRHLRRDRKLYVQRLTALAIGE